MKYLPLCAILASLIVLIGCETTDISTDTSVSADADADATGGDIGSDVTGDTAGSDADVVNNDTYLQPDETLVKIHAKTPDNKPAKFYVCHGGYVCPGDSTKDDHVFENVTEIDVMEIADWKYGSEFFVAVERKDHLFSSWYVQTFKNLVKPTGVEYLTYDWSAPGSWGLAPNGTYLDSDDGQEKTVETKVDVEYVVISDGFAKGIVDNKKILPKEGAYISWEGEISDDLTTITYSMKNTEGYTWNGTLTLVK